MSVVTGEAATADIVVSGGGLRVCFRPAPPLTLHGDSCWRTDGNSPVLIGRDSAVAFFSRYDPIGHTLRRVGRPDLQFDAPPVPVRFLDDPEPGIGKWIEAVWQEPGGALHGWFHAETPVAGASKLFLPHMGRAVSGDDGLTWRHRGDLLRLPIDRTDLSWRNGFFAGGYGDLSALPDREGRWIYVFFSSYHPDEKAQGVTVLRLPAADPSTAPALWTEEGWSTDGRRPPRPLWPMRRGWRHADPDGFWGPAVHYNRALGAFVMLLNRTAGGTGDLVQEGIYASVNRDLSDPEAWSAPLRIGRGGAWYPQAIGLEEGCGDAEVGTAGRFFMAGFSAWTIEFSRVADEAKTGQPLACTVPQFAALFGADRRCPW
ncbi:hypothetical protein [Reyranella sp.]|uniref:hypothetical protein n=1 Tax=Reyranella sp. TaxID=1929291 RepID=UPI002605773B|nr:hypothetical protein [Reyranella sp.]HQS14024.1 hypothetical protein [Reyranella sp.]HQT10509.1 hypothetical protein [Reyranella sp.]